jgi:hypothetical protein
VNPRYPLYIVSKGRWESRLTSKALERIRVPYTIVIEEQEYDKYAAAISPDKILVLDKRYQDEYDIFSDVGAKSTGAGAVRNFVWEHAISRGFNYHWVMDDNIRTFFRLNRNLAVPVGDGTMFRVCEDFVKRYENVYMAGPNYFMFISFGSSHPPFVMNTRIYSCNLIKNDIPYRWRGRYNEDTDLSLRILKDGYCTVQFNAFLQRKETTQSIRGGNTDELYKNGTLVKSKQLRDMHPDVTKVVWKFGRWHHHVDYSKFKGNKLIPKPGVTVRPGINNYGMKLVKVTEEKGE